MQIRDAQTTRSLGLGYKSSRQVNSRPLAPQFAGGCGGEGENNVGTI